MKKFTYLLLLAALVMGATACKDNETKLNSQIAGELLVKSQLIGDDDASAFKVTTTNYSGEFDYSDSKYTITLTAIMEVGPSAQATLQLKNQALTWNNSKGYYSFSIASLDGNITNLNGYYYPFYGTMAIEFVYNGTYRVTSVAHLSYPYVETKVLDKQGGNTFTSKNPQMAIVVGPATMTARMRILNLKTSDEGLTFESLTVNDGLKVKPTETGYEITGENLQTEISGYVITAFNATATDDGKRLSGTLTINDRYEVTLTADMFKNEDSYFE